MKMEILTVNMQNIGVLAQKEAIAVRIITVLTLIYLPATFVSVSLSQHKYFFSPKSLSNRKSFFSTDVVKYQNQNQGSSQDAQEPYSNFSELAMHRWLQVALPLTAVTLVLGWLGYRWAERKQHKKLPFYKIELNSESDA
jgi:hypothetical protein